MKLRRDSVGPVTNNLMAIVTRHGQGRGPRRQLHDGLQVSEVRLEAMRPVHQERIRFARGRFDNIQTAHLSAFRMEIHTPS